VNNDSLARRKKPKEGDAHLSFSITRQARHDQSNHSHVKKGSYTTKKDQHREELEDDDVRRGFLNRSAPRDSSGSQKTDVKSATSTKTRKKSEPKKSKNSANAVRVTLHKHQRSPYVVAIKKEIEKVVEDVAVKQVIARVGEAKQEAVEDWRKEVERLRRDASTLRTSMRDSVRINFLGQQTKKRSFSFFSRPSVNHDKKRIERSVLPKMEQPRASRTSRRWPVRALFGIVRWCYEMLLSIPLGVLLLLHGLIILTDFFFRGTARLTWYAGSIGARVVEQVAFSCIAIARGMVLIPIKIVVIAVLGIYRICGFFGVKVMSLFRILGEWFSHMVKTMAHPPRGLYPRAALFGVIAISVIIPVKYLERAPARVVSLEGQVLGAAQEGFSVLNSLETGNISAAQEQLDTAHARFSEARNTLDSLNVAVRGLIKLTPQGAAGFHLVAAAEEMTAGAAALSKAFLPLLSNDNKGVAMDKIQSIAASLRDAEPRIDAAASHISQVSADAVPQEYRDQFNAIQTAMPVVQSAVLDMADLIGVLASVLGADRPMHYAVLFQNNNELRPAGGFIGSLAMADFDQGRLSNIKIPGGGSYDFQGYLTAHVISPKPLWIVNPHWQLHDANWYPDWPTSAEKVAWFIEKSGQSSVDGVIALQATTLEKLLRILGPVEFPEYGATLDADNVIRKMQEAVELDYDKEENQPKQYVAELVPHVIDRILGSDSKQFVELLSLVEGEIEQKNILLYFRDPNIQQAFEERNWSPRIIQSTGDYLSVVNANIGGGKTDGVIEESWNHEVIIADDGTITEKLDIVRHHAGNPDDVFESYNNVDYARLYAPQGSELISAVGFEPPKSEFFQQPEPYYTADEQLSSIEGKVLVDEATSTRINNEFGKTVFGNWVQTMPGGTSLATYTYKAPFRVKPFDLLNPDAKSGYSLLVQKQPGARPVYYSLILKYPPDWEIDWKKVAGDATLQEIGLGTVMFESDLKKDIGFGVLFKNAE